MPSQLDLTAVLTADSRVWVKETQRAAKSFNNLTKTVQTQASQTQKVLAKLAKFAKGTLAVAIGFSLSRKIMQTASSLKRLGKEAVFGAARVEQMSSVLDMLGRKLGFTSRKMGELTEEIRSKGIEMGIAQNTLQEFIRYEMDLTKSTELARVAQDAAVMSNSNSSETLQRLIYGISRQNSLILRNAGIQVMAGAAIDKHAASLNKSADQLTANERTQGVLNAVLEEGIKIQGAYEESLKEPIKKLGSLQRIWDDISGQIGDTLYPAFKVFINEIWDPYVKWIAKVTASGTKLNNFLSDFGNAAAAAFHELAEWVKHSDTFKQISESVMSIAGSFAAVWKAFGPFAKAMVTVKTFEVSMAALAAILKALERVAKPLALLLQAMITVKMVAMMVAFGKSVLANVQYQYLLKKELLTNAAGLTAFGGSATAATVGVTTLTRATMVMTAALKAMFPILLAFTAIALITKKWGDFKTVQDQVNGTAKELNRTIRDQNRLVEDSQAALSAWIDESSRFATEEQIGLLNEMSIKVGLTRDRLLGLLQAGDAAARTEFLGMIREVGGLVPATAEEIEKLENSLHGLDRTMAEQARRKGFYVDAQGNIFKGNQDLIVSFDEVSAALQLSARNTVIALAAESDAHMHAVGQMIDVWGEATMGRREYEDALQNNPDFYKQVLSGEIPLINNWIEAEERLNAQIDLNEQHLMAQEMRAEAARKELTEYGQEAKKLSGIIEDLTDEQNDHWIATVKNDKAYKGLVERLDTTAARFEIFNRALFNAFDAADAQNSITRTLTTTLEAFDDGTAGAGATVKSVFQLIRTQALPAAKKYGLSLVDAANAAEGSEEAAALMRQGMEETKRNFIAAAEEAGILTDRVRHLTEVMFGLEEVDTTIQFVLDLGLGFNIDAIRQAIAKLESDLPTRMGQMVQELRTILMMLVAEPARETDALGRSLKNVGDLEQLITGHITDQVKAREKGWRAIQRYRRAVENVHDIEEDINDLLDERNKLEKENSKVQLQQELSLLRQNRTIIQLGHSLEDIQRRNEEIFDPSAPTLEALEAERDALIAQAAEITEVEDELIKRLKVLTDEQAKSADVTAIEAAEIEDLWIEMKAAKRQMEAGIISNIQYQAAQQRVTDAVEAAIGKSEELIAVEAAIIDIDRSLATASLDLAIAEKEVALATVNLTETMSAEEAVGEALIAVQKELKEAAYSQADAVMEQESAYIDLAGVAPEVVDALDFIKEKGLELATTVTVLGTKLSDALHDAAVSAQDLYPEFELLQTLLEGIEERMFDAKEIDAFVTLLQDGLAGLDLSGWDLVNKIKGILEAEGWESDWIRFGERIQTFIDENWDLSAIIEAIWNISAPNIPDIPGISVDVTFVPGPMPGGDGGGDGDGGGGGGGGTGGGGGGVVEEILTAGQLLQDIAAATLENVDISSSFIDPVIQQQLEDRIDATNQLLTGTGEWGAAFGQLTAEEIAEALAGLPNLHEGGTIKRSGIAQVHAGETVTPKGGGGATYNINIGAGISDPTAVSEAVVEALRAYERGNGPVPVTTTASMYTASS